MLYDTGTDEMAIINLLTKRTNEQRQQILVKFKLMYGKVGPAWSTAQSCNIVTVLYTCTYTTF